MMALVVLGLAGIGVAGLLAHVVFGALGDMAREETRTRLESIPFVLLELAASRIPAELRPDLEAEWRAELAFHIDGTEGMPVTRIARGIRFAASLLRGAPDVTRGFTGQFRDTWATARREAGVVVTVIGLILVAGGAIEAATTTQHAYGAACICLASCLVMRGACAALGRKAGNLAATVRFAFVCVAGALEYVARPSPLLLLSCAACLLVFALTVRSQIAFRMHARSCPACAGEPAAGR